MSPGISLVRHARPKPDPLIQNHKRPAPRTFATHPRDALPATLSRLSADSPNSRTTTQEHQPVAPGRRYYHSQLHHCVGRSLRAGLSCSAPSLVPRLGAHGLPSPIAGVPHRQNRHCTGTCGAWSQSGTQPAHSLNDASRLGTPREPGSGIPNPTLGVPGVSAMAGFDPHRERRVSASAGATSLSAPGDVASGARTIRNPIGFGSNDRPGVQDLDGRPRHHPSIRLATTPVPTCFGTSTTNSNSAVTPSPGLPAAPLRFNQPQAGESVS